MFSLRNFTRISSRLQFRLSSSLSEDNPYFSKYASKLKKLQDDNPSEFDSKLDDIKKKQRKKLLVNADGTIEDGVTAEDLTSKYPRQTSEPVRIESPEELQALSIEQLGSVWKSRHANKDAICGLVKKDHFETMAKRGVEFPLFVYPVPRDDGYEMYLGQVSAGGSEVHFTPLSQFHRNQSEAVACLRLKFFTDFLETKQIVLMAGEYKGDVIGPEHAQCLANQHQIYYGSAELKRKLMLWNFNKEPKSFNHEVLIEEFQKHIGNKEEGVILN